MSVMVSNFHQQSNDLTSRFGLAKPMRFQQQAQFHDETAVPLVRQYLETTWGCTTYLDGKETRDPPVSEQLYAENPDLNYDPDIQAQHPHWSKLVEVKSESPNYNNFAIHVDSWEATKRLNANHPLAF